MENITPEEKNKFTQKFNEFQLKGLKSYLKYLEQEIENSKGSTIRDAYIKYTKDQIEQTKAKIDRLS